MSREKSSLYFSLDIVAFVRIALILLPHLKPRYRSGLGREHSSYPIEFSLVRRIFQGISFFLYLAQGFLCSAVKLELEDIHVVRSLHYAIYSAAALNFLRIDGIDTYQAHYQIERVVEVAFTLSRVLKYPAATSERNPFLTSLFG